MTRLLRLTGDAHPVGLQAEQSGQQPDRPVLDVLRECLKSRT